MPAAKSLAENIFRAAIAANNVSVVSYLLNCTDMIDVNETVCHHAGRRYTPLEMATKMHCLDVARLFVGKQADVNKSFRRSFDPNVLDLLVDSEASKSALSDDFLNLIDVLVEKRSTLSMQLISTVLKRFTDQRLAIRLLEQSARHSAKDLVSDTQILVDIVMNLDRENTTHITTLIMKEHRISVGSQKPDRFYPHIYAALYRALESEYEEVFETLIPSVFSIRDILAQEVASGSEVATRSLFMDIHTFLSSQHIRYMRTSPLLKKDGPFYEQQYLPPLNPLPRSGEVGKALTKAIQIGKLEDANRILDLDPDLDFADAEELYLDDAFNSALADSNFHDIAWRLLALVMTSIYEYRDGGYMPLLYFAMINQEFSFVDAILESGFILNMEFLSAANKWSIIEAAINTGYYDKVFQGPWGVTLGYDSKENESLLELALQNERHDVFLYILDHVSSSYRWDAFNMALRHESLTLVDEVLAWSSSIKSDELFTESIVDAIKEHPSMMEPLLVRLKSIFPEGASRYSSQLVEYAVKKYPETSSLVDLLLEHSFITTNTTIGNKDIPSTLYIAIDYPYWHDSLPNTSLLKKLLLAGVDINVITTDYPSKGFYCQTTALLRAIEPENMEVIRLLVAYKADINEPALQPLLYVGR